MGQPQDSPPRLNLVASKQLPEPCTDSTISYCPTMDLIAVATGSGVTVFRLNGQRVFGIANGGGEDAWTVVRDGLTWSSNGQFLAIAGSDSVVRLVNAFNGKVVHQLSSHLPMSDDKPRADISMLSWTPCFADGAATQKHLNAAGDSVSLDDLLVFNPQISTLLKLKADLPRALSELDVESSLPKLATLPSTGGDDDVFSSRASVDAIFHSSRLRNQNDMVDVLLTAYEDEHATIKVKIFSSFEIGDVQLSSSIPSSNSKIPAKVIKQASHPFLSTQFLLVQHRTSLHLIRLDLNFIPQTSPHYLPILATKATQLENLLRYLTQIESQLSHEMKAAFDLPSRYLSNVTESIKQQNEEADFHSEVWHLICTGDCSEVMREWMVDEVGDRGVKRWEKGVSDALEVVRRGVSECILPCLERIYFVLSRLEGLARFAKSRKVLGLDEKMIESVRATTDAVNLLSNDLLRTVGEELRAFESFMKWFKGEIEIQGMEITSERREELSIQRGDETDVRAVLGYVDGSLSRSKVLDFLLGGSKQSISDFMAKEAGEKDDNQFYERYKAARRKLHGQKATADAKLPRLDELIHRLKGQCAKVFERIATALRKSIQHAHILTLDSNCDPECLDMRVSAEGVPGSPDRLKWEVWVAAKTQNSSGQVLSTKAQGEDSISLPSSHAIAPIEFEDAVLDVRFVDDAHIMVLLANDEGAGLVRYEFQERRSVLLHRFDGDLGRPVKLEVNGRKGRRAVCVLESGGASYEVFDLDSQVERDGDDGNIDGEDEDQAEDEDME